MKPFRAKALPQGLGQAVPENRLHERQSHRVAGCSREPREAQMEVQEDFPFLKPTGWCILGPDAGAAVHGTSISGMRTGAIGHTLSYPCTRSQKTFLGHIEKTLSGCLERNKTPFRRTKEK